MRHSGGLSVHCLSTHCGSPRQTEGHSFGNRLVSESVIIMPPSVTEDCFYCALFCVFMAHVRYNLEQRVFIYDCYVKKLIQIVQEKILS
jgi:hypothetical protein